MPGVTVSIALVRKRLERLREKGEVDRTRPGRYRLAHALSMANPASSGDESGQQSTLRGRMLARMKQEPERGWRPRDLVDAIHVPNRDYLRTLLRQMVRSDQLVQNEEGRYHLPSRTNGTADAVVTDGRVPVTIL